MNEQLILERRKNRTIKELLSFKESVVDPFLPLDVSVALRKEILDAINSLCGFVEDMMAPNVNDLYIEKLDKILDVVSGTDE